MWLFRLFWRGWRELVRIFNEILWMVSQCCDFKSLELCKTIGCTNFNEQVEMDEKFLLNYKI